MRAGRGLKAATGSSSRIRSRRSASRPLPSLLPTPRAEDSAVGVASLFASVVRLPYAPISQCRLSERRRSDQFLLRTVYIRESMNGKTAENFGGHDDSPIDEVSRGAEPAQTSCRPGRCMATVAVNCPRQSASRRRFPYKDPTAFAATVGPAPCAHRLDGSRERATTSFGASRPGLQRFAARRVASEPFISGEQWKMISALPFASPVSRDVSHNT